MAQRRSRLLTSRNRSIEQAKVIALDAKEGVNETVVGSKAMSLIRLKQIGFPVPPGFCIMAAAFRDHLGKNGLIPYIKSNLDKLEKATPNEKRDLLLGIQQTIVNAGLATELKQEIEGHYRQLGAVPVAVRSSATAEDLPGHSFAGQYETFLDVKDLASCLDAIKKCWASLWTERAYNYRRNNDFDHLSVDMAVIVQAMVPADTAGVIFTIDPVTGQLDQMILEACFGLGEVLVSGKVTPDRFVVAKDDLRILSRSISGERMEHAQEKRQQLCTSTIDDDVVRRLVKLAKKAEKAFGAPQDMEWAVRGGKLYFLQSRPITAIPQTKSLEERQVWSNFNTGEVLPDVITPMNWSLINLLGTALFDTVFGQIGLELGDAPLAAEIAGRVYFNLNTFVGAMRCFPGVRRMDLSKVMGGEQGKMFEKGQLVIADEDIPKLNFSVPKMLFRIPGLIYWTISYSPKRGEAFVDRMKHQVEELRRIDLSSLSENELVDGVHSAINEVFGCVRSIAFAGMAMFYFNQLSKVCRKWLGDDEGTIANRLLTGLGGMDSAEAGLEMWRLSTLAHKNLTVEKAILEGATWGKTCNKLACINGGDEFLVRWDAFMSEHGHHTRGELEVSNPRWCEMPDYVLDAVHGYLSAIGHTDPIAHHRRQTQMCHELAEACRRNLRNPIKRQIFNFYLKQAQSGSVVRENVKSTGIRYWAAIRMMLLELGKRFAERRILDSRDDIFFLNLEEIDPVRQGKTVFDVKETVARRKAEHARNLRIIPPKVVIGKFDPGNYVPDEVEDRATVLSGLAASAGIVTGRARVILRADDSEHVRPGEILVAPFTDPGWTPYFLPAAAIVMDQGGLLSHGSIVAREYGIPAVVNVGPATKIIKTGQTIQVDGNRGLVRILD